MLIIFLFNIKNAERTVLSLYLAAKTYMYNQVDQIAIPPLEMNTMFSKRSHASLQCSELLNP